MTFGSDKETAMPPTDARLKKRSLVFSQYSPPSIDFHTPPPGDVVIAAYGYRARDDPQALAIVVPVCAAASTVGTLVPYALTWRFGEGVALRMAGWLEIDRATVKRWEDRIKRGGFRAVFIGRLVPGARVVMSLLAGTSK